MTLLRDRTGLSFELAPAAPVDPLRTDVAVFVGLLARRAATLPAEAPVPLPPLLEAWLRRQRLVSATAQTRWRGAPVRLDTPESFVVTLVQALGDDPGDDPGDEADGAGAAVRAAFAAIVADGGRHAALQALLDACRQTAALPRSVVDDLLARDLGPRTLGDAAELAHWARMQRLFDLPVRVESLEAVEALFETATRAVLDRPRQPGDAAVAPPMATALRAFFGEGGQCAYVVRTGDPVPVLAAADARQAAAFPPAAAADRCALFADPDAAPEAAAVALSATDWHGLEQVYAVPEASFVLLPDLIDAAAIAPPALQPPEVVATAEVFKDCVDEGAAKGPAAGRCLPPPRLDAEGLARWRQWVRRALALLDNGGRPFHRRDVQLLVSLPLVAPGPGQPGPDDWLDWMAGRGGWLSAGASTGLLDARLQLAWPWPVTRDSAADPGGVEPPEGSLAGVLARSALQRGSFRSAARQPLWRLVDTEPRPGWTRALERELATPLGRLTLADRVCLLAPGAAGARLASDVSAAADEVFRQASVRRLVNVVIQAARRLGEAHAFEPNGERLWARLRSRLGELLRQLEADGALTRDGGASEARCGRDTMTQADLDAGRLIVEIGLRPAQPVQRIVVVLNLRDAPGARALAIAA